METLRQAKVEHLKSRGELPDGGEDAVLVEAHDTSFYHNQILKSKYGVDNEAIKVMLHAPPSARTKVASD
eukprot:COSAG06_NODE_65200_length_257_cov_1.303797_1_plen_69_part_01